MAYKLIDGQGQGQKEDMVFVDKHEIIDHLTYFHDNDWNGEEDLNTFLRNMKNDDERLDFLCDYGDWEVVEVTD